MYHATHVYVVFMGALNFKFLLFPLLNKVFFDSFTHSFIHLSIHSIIFPVCNESFFFFKKLFILVFFYLYIYIFFVKGYIHKKKFVKDYVQKKMS